MRAIIFANGRYEAPYSPQPQDLIIAADGGARHCLAHGIQPAAVIGDLDSLSPDELATLEKGGAQVLSYPTRKDYTDLELAIEYALKFQPSMILILAGLGGRWDQTIANLLLAATQSTVTVHLIDGAQEFYFLHGGEQIEIHGRCDDIVSLIPLGGDARGITTQGLEYPIEDETLLFGSTRGVSNVLLEDHATISMKGGLLLCTIIHSDGSPGFIGAAGGGAAPTTTIQADPGEPFGQVRDEE